MSTFRNGQICYFKKSKKKFGRTLVQGGGGQPQSVQVRTGGRGVQKVVILSVRTLWMLP